MLKKHEIMAMTGIDEALDKVCQARAVRVRIGDFEITFTYATSMLGIYYLYIYLIQIYIIFIFN